MADEPEEHVVPKRSKKELFLESFDMTYPQDVEPVEREDIGGLDAIVEELDRFKRGVEHPFLYEIMGARPPKGFMLEGEPGTGKTMIAKYIATNLGARFVDLPLTMFESKWVGEAEKQLQGHLENFKNYYRLTGQPVLVFFDEAEEVFKSRTAEGWHGPRVNVLLREMDGLGSSDGVLFGAATNHVSKCDAAILRPGRLDFVLKIPEYTAAMLGDVFRAQARYRNRKSLKSWGPYRLSVEDCAELGRKSHSMKLTPADIAEIYRRVAEGKIKAILEKPDDVIDMEKHEYTIVRQDLESLLQSYTRNGEKIKRKIGFV